MHVQHCPEIQMVFVEADTHILPSLSGLSYLEALDYPGFVISAIESIGLPPSIGIHTHHAMF